MGFWEKTENQERYAKWLGEQLGFKTMEDWYKIGKELIHNHFGGGLLSQYYNNSPSQFVKTLFPDEDWLEWKFGLTFRGFWEKTENQERYAKWLGEQLGFKTMEDWYKITYIEISSHYGGGLVASYYNSSPFQFVKGSILQ